jgi:hypothetical protein
MVRFARWPLAAVVSLSTIGLAAPVAAQEAPPSTAIQRPAVLIPLYASFATLQVVDLHSSWRALDRGAIEANPLLKGLVGSEIGLAAVKAAGTASVFYATERMLKRNRKAAIVFMIATNSAMAWVVHHNYRAVR